MFSTLKNNLAIQFRYKDPKARIVRRNSFRVIASLVFKNLKNSPKNEFSLLKYYKSPAKSMNLLQI